MMYQFYAGITGRRALALLLLFMALAPAAQARIHPVNGAVLSQTEVLFEYDEVPGADFYEVVVRADYALPGAPPLLRQRSSSLTTIAREGLLFGNGYQWYFEAFKGGKVMYKSSELFFTIKICPFADTTLYRFHISLAKKGRYQDGLVFIDQLGLAINRAGVPVWFLPSQADSIAGPFRNMQLTADGTITYLDNSDCREVSTDGTLLWRGPNDGKVSGDATEYYHHDFSKLPNSNFLTSSYFYKNQPNFFDNSVTTRVRYNTLVEYDAAGKVVWQWNERDHTTPEAMFRNSRSDELQNEGTHLNGFSYDARSNGLLLSFRNNSTILKIDKATGKILYNLADALGRGKTAPYNSQHGPFVMRNGNVLVYNNNSQSAAEGGTDTPWPQVQQYRQPGNGLPAQLVWAYEVRSDRFRNGIRGKEGYVQELPNGNFLVCVGGANFTFEVTPKKEPVWECIFEKQVTTPEGQPDWKPFTNYRAHFSNSLYPRWFTVQQISRSRASLGARPALQVRVNNEGMMADSYTLVLTGLNGTALKPQTLVLQARSSRTVSFALPAGFLPAGQQAGRVGLLTVYPTNNPSAKQEMVVELF